MCIRGPLVCPLEDWLYTSGVSYTVSSGGNWGPISDFAPLLILILGTLCAYS